jgi:hypothetical protein
MIMIDDVLNMTVVQMVEPALLDFAAVADNMSLLLCSYFRPLSRLGQDTHRGTHS